MSNLNFDDKNFEILDTKMQNKFDYVCTSFPTFDLLFEGLSRRLRDNGT